MSRRFRGAVASGHAAVTAAAREMLESGGNAFDAVVAAGFAASVAEPMFTSLGGGGFLLARPAGGPARVFDFFVDAPGRGLPAALLEPHFVPMTVHFPASDQVFHVGLGSVAVPGNLAGFLTVHERLGRLPLDEIVAPAVALARDGVVLNPHQAYVQELLTPIITLTEAGRRIYTPEGRGLAEGDRLCNPDQARFLETLPEGARALYAGDLAERIAADMHEGGGLLTREDLAAYRVVEREPLAIGYRGVTVLTNPPPSPGGTLIASSLERLAERLDPTVAWGSPEHLGTVAAVMQEVERERARPASGGTTHVSIVDAEGSAASLSLSNGEGSGYLVPGTGIMLNNMLGEDDLHPEGFHASPPGERVGSMMSPTVVVGGDGAIRLVLGSGGSKRIRSAIVQVATSVLDFGRGLAIAVRSPRIHWDGEAFQAEPGLPADGLTRLRQAGPVNAWDALNLYFGGVHAVAPATGEAAGDPRRMGDAVVL